jgi:hypothetical protein
VGKPELRRPLGRPRLKSECKIKNDLEEAASRVGRVDWIDVAKDKNR